jgi:hypothetical protein
VRNRVLTSAVTAWLAFSGAYVRWAGPRASRELLLVGAVWLALTLAFELGFGRASGKTWRELLADYDVAGVLVATLLGPWA